MRIEKLSKMEKGWFIGDFEPSVLKTSAFEVAIKHYNAGDSEELHHHKVAAEYTVIVSGKARMNSRACFEGDIIILEPGESSDFLAVTDVTTAVVKVPSAKGDKHRGRLDA